MRREDVLRIRDAIYQSLLVRNGNTFSDGWAMDRASNIAQWLETAIDDIVDAALMEAARGVVVVGEIGPIPPPPRNPGDVTDVPAKGNQCPGCLGAHQHGPLGCE